MSPSLADSRGGQSVASSRGRRVRSSLILLTLCVGALLASWLQLARDSARLPLGSSYSAQDDGAAALYLWSESVGASPRRLRTTVWPTDQAPRALLVVQPESPITRAERDAFDDVARAGGTLILAGDSSALQVYARQLGVPFEPIQTTTSVLDSTDDETLPVGSRYRMRRTGTPLLTTSTGDVIAQRQSYLQGTLIVIATPQPLTNSALRTSTVAQFVYRTLLSEADALAFDEVHHSYSPVTEDQPATIDGLLFDTAPGRAIVYCAILTFVFLLLAGRRLGPPLAERGSTQVRRTMYEHVQMLAGLYRRAAQLATVRAAFERHYQRRAARTVMAPARAALFDEALLRVHAAHSEADLITAVSAAERALSAR